MDARILSAIDERLDEIYDDFEQNLLRVWGRKDVLIAIDLVYHSVLSFFFQDSFIQRGYLELLVIGDSGQAKTTLVDGMRSHYELGERISGETASRTGLVYTIQENQRRRFLTWGAIPLNDRRILIIDEFSGIAPEEIENMSSMRATGIAEVNRSIKSRTAARTRLIFLSNTRDGRMLQEYQNGVEAIDKLFTKKEDIRRLDFAITVASGEVPISEINRKHKSIITHRFLSRTCRNLILWAWSRKPNQIIFQENTVEKILELASQISRRFHAQIPLVEPADMRIKLARLGAALAARLYSTNDHQSLIILPEHVQWVYNFLCRIYAKPSMAYDLFSQERQSEAIIKDEGAIKRLITPYGLDFTKRLLQLKQISIVDIEVLTNDRDKAKNLLTQLYLANAVKKVRSYYVATAAFITFLKRLVQEVEPSANSTIEVKPHNSQPISTVIATTVKEQTYEHQIDHSEPGRDRGQPNDQDYPEYTGREPGDEPPED